MHPSSVWQRFRLTSVRARLTALSLVLMLPLLLFATVNAYRSHQTVDQTEAIVRVQVPATVSALRLLNTVGNTGLLTRSYVISQNDRYLGARRHIIDHDIPALLASLRNALQKEPEQLAVLKELEGLFTTIGHEQDLIIEDIRLAVKANDLAAGTDTTGLRLTDQEMIGVIRQANRSLEEKILPVGLLLGKKIDALIGQQTQTIQTRSTALVQDLTQQNLVIFSLTSLIFVLGLGTTQRMVRRLVGAIGNLRDTLNTLARGQLPATLPGRTDEIGTANAAANQLADNLRRASQFAAQIGEGQFDSHFAAAGPHDVLGNALLTTRDQLLAAHQSDQQRRWLADGLTQLSDTLRTHTDLITLAERLVSQLVKYLNANQGGLFVVREEGEVSLELVASYAYQRQKFIEKSVLPGQGLVGQTYLEAETIHLTNLPDHYLRIGSGLGDARPRCLLLVPLKTNDQVRGVLELASFRPFEPLHIALVEQLAEGVASALTAMSVNEKTRRLLAEAQQNAAQLRMQEEETRQNVEELQATQENQQRLQMELRHSEEQMRHRLTELESSRAEVERTRALEIARAKEQMDAQKKIITATLDKFKNSERDLRAEIQRKQTEIEILQSTIQNQLP